VVSPSNASVLSCCPFPTTVVNDVRYCCPPGNVVLQPGGQCCPRERVLTDPATNIQKCCPAGQTPIDGKCCR
jgi:hypothetical protein